MFKSYIQSMFCAWGMFEGCVQHTTYKLEFVDNAMNGHR